MTALPRGDRWHALARQALRDDLYRSLQLITAEVLTTTDPNELPADRIRHWEERNNARLRRARKTLDQITSTAASDVAALSVAARQIRAMAR